MECNCKIKGILSERNFMRPSWGIPEVTWRSLGRCWVPFEASWKPLGRVLGASWGDLEASWGVLGPLGALLRPLGVVFWGYVAAGIFFIICCWILDRSWGSKGSPNRPQIDPKTVQNRRQKSTWKMIAFGTLLDPSWARLGAFWDRSWGQK